MALTIAPATAERWDDLTDLFGPNGACSGCWCTFLLMSNTEWNATPKDVRREQLRELVAGRDAGLLAYDGERALGWCALGPRPRYVRLTLSRALPVATDPDRDDPGVWSVPCFVTRPRHRGRGVATALLHAAVEFARERGAHVLEGYPLDPALRRPSNAEAYHGLLPMFLDAGFVELPRTKPNRPVVRLTFA